MRTTKEKAIELVERFLALKKINPNAITRPYNWQEAKQCALICVDEILDAVTTIADKKFDFYTEVKKEIEKL